MNGLDYILIGAILVAVFLAVRHVRKNKGGCGCSCKDCKSSCRNMTHKK